MFSEELGYVVYDSYSAGIYIAVLAPVVPIMYLDHVTDSVLKGIGEQVYSMWVNISDSILSIILVWFLIPRMGIMGYAVCIVVMEGYNFILSAIRLCKRIRFRVSFLKAILYPIAASGVSAFVSSHLFINTGSQTSGFWLTLEIAFATCMFAAAYKGICMIDEWICHRREVKIT
jgi:stage V sporulation protein B